MNRKQEERIEEYLAQIDREFDDYFTKEQNSVQ